MIAFIFNQWHVSIIWFLSTVAGLSDRMIGNYPVIGDNKYTRTLPATLCHTDAKSGLAPNLILETRVLGEVEKNSFIALPGKEGHSGLMPSKLSVPTRGSL